MPDDRVDATAAAWRIEIAGATLPMPAGQGEAVRVDRAAASEAGAASARA